MKYLLPKETAARITALEMVRSKYSTSLLGRILGVLFLALLVSLVVVPWQQTSKGYGRVAAYSPSDRQQNISAPVEGRLGKWFVHEGSVVKEGDPIVEILDNDPDILIRLRAERDAIERRLIAARKAANTSLINVSRQKELFNQGISSRRAFEQAEIEYARYLTDEANSSAELSKIEVRLARQSMQSVKATRSGTILRRVLGQESVIVKPGEVLAVIVPDTDSRAVELWVDGNDVPLISEGRHVRLQFEGWPAVQFSGWPSVAVGTFGGKVSLIDAADSGNGMFRVLVVPEEGESWPSHRYLRQGIRAYGWILLNRVSLGYELWRQFNGFPPSFPESKKPDDLLESSVKKK